MFKKKGGLGREARCTLHPDATPLFERRLEQNEGRKNIDTKLTDIIDDVTGDKSRERFDSVEQDNQNVRQNQIEIKEII